MREVQYLDLTGNPRDVAWLVQQFGGPFLHQTSDMPRFELRSLQQVRDLPRVLEVTVLNENGLPRPGVTVALGSGVHHVERVAITDQDGIALFDIDDVAYRYPAPSQSAWVCGIKDGHSDFYNCVGWVAGKIRQDWLDLTFVYVEPEPEPEPEPPEPPTPEPTDEQWAELFARLERIEALLRAVVGEM